LNDIKVGMRSRQSKNDKQHNNSQRKKDKRTNNDLQIINIEPHESHKRAGVISGATEHWFWSQARVDTDVISSFIKFYYNQNLDGIHVVLDGAKYTLDNCYK
jgi:hypothetical protein